MKRILTINSVLLILFLVDRCLKILLTKLPTNLEVFGWSAVKLSYNSNIAFSLPISNLLAMIISSIIIIALIYFYLELIKLPVYPMAIGLIIIGACSNLIDRIQVGGVIDFIALWWWPAFNLADAYICTGALLLLFAYRRLDLSKK